MATTVPVPPATGPALLVAVADVERSSCWRRWRHLPPVGAPVVLVRSLHDDRLNVVDDITLEVLGWVPRAPVAGIADPGGLPVGVVREARAGEPPALRIALGIAEPPIAVVGGGDDGRP